MLAKRRCQISVARWTETQDRPWASLAKENCPCASVVTTREMDKVGG